MVETVGNAPTADDLARIICTLVLSPWCRGLVSSQPPRLQRGAFTRLASSAELVRTPVIETGSPEWRSDARPSSYAREDGGKWTESNLLPAGTAFTARRRHQPVLMALPVFGCGPPRLHRAVAAYETAWVPNRPARMNDAKAFNSLACCRYVHGSAE